MSTEFSGSRAHALRGWLAALAVGAIGASTASAANFVVNTLVDENDGVGTGGVSLRDAINAANANPDADTITFSVSGTITLTADLPNITEDLTITGPGASSLTLSGAGAYRAFKIMNSADVVMSAFTVSNMYARGGDGRSTNSGGGGGAAAGMGAAVFLNAGTARVSSVTFTGNQAIGGDGGLSTGGSTYAGGGGGGFGAPAATEIDGSGGGFLGGSGGGAGFPGNPGGEGAGGGGGGGHSGPIPSAGGGGGFGGGGGGGSAGDFATDSSGNGGTGGFGGGGGGRGRNNTTSTATGGAGGSFGGNGGDGSGSNQGGGGGGAGLGGAVFVRAGTLMVVNCTLSSNVATGGVAGGNGATNGQGKGGAIFVNSGAIVRASGVTYSSNSATDDVASGTDNDNFYGTIGAIPSVASITRAAANPSSASSVTFTVTFSASVTGVNAADFQVDASGVTGASISSVTGSGTTYTVTVNAGSGSGTLSIDLVDDDSIVDADSFALGGPGTTNGDFSTGEAYTMDRVAPTVIISGTPAGVTNADSASFVVYFSEDVTGFSNSDATVNHSGTTHSSVTVTPVSAAIYNISVDGIAGDGSFTISVNASAASDAAGNATPAAGPSATVQIDNTAPGLTITPASTDIGQAESTTFTLTFTEVVSDFISTDVFVSHSGTTHQTVNLTTTDNVTFTATIGGIGGTGSFSIWVLAGAASDAAANFNAELTTSVSVARHAPVQDAGSGSEPETEPTPESVDQTPVSTDGTAEAEGEAIGGGAVAAETATDDSLTDPTAACGAGACGAAGMFPMLTVAGLMVMKRRPARTARRDRNGAAASR